MSDTQPRPSGARGGRGSAARGGRGGIASRGARNPIRSATNGDANAKQDQEHTSLPTLEDQGEIADLNKTYGSKIELVKGIFPNWSDVDILYALKETDGDETTVIERIIEGKPNLSHFPSSLAPVSCPRTDPSAPSTGSLSQWDEVSKKDRTKAKAKDTFTTTTGTDVPASNTNRAARGGRPDAARGRGRATERGARGAARGRSVAPTTNGSRPKDSQPLSVPTDESNAWGAAKTNDDGGWASAAAATSWEPAAPTSSAATTTAATAPAVSATPPEPAKSAVIPQGTSKTWANMLRQSTVPKSAPLPPKELSAPVPEPVLEPLPPATDPVAAPVPDAEPEPIAELSAEPQSEHTPDDDTLVVEPEIVLPPSVDQLTKTNLEQVKDDSNPPQTDTTASEAADSWDPRAIAGSATATPISASQAQHQAPHKVPASGYAATAIKATERAPVPRAPAHPQRRFLDQQEAVRMPGAVSQQLERATVQFGAFNLNGTEEDIDGDREEPETRAQPPADSPVAQPRASLPPAPQAVPDAYTAQLPVSSLPPGAAPTGTDYPFFSHKADPRHMFERHMANTNAAFAGPQVPPTAPAAQQPVAQGTQPVLLFADLHIQPLGNSKLTHSSATAAAPHIPTHPAAQQYSRFGQAEQPGYPQKHFDTYNQTNQPAATAQSHFDAFPGQPQTQPQAQAQQPGGPYSSAAEQYSSYATADYQNRGTPYNNYYGQSYGQQQQQAAQGQEGGLGSRAGFGAAYGGTQADLASQYPQSANQSRFAAAGAQDPTSGPSTPVPQTTQGPPASQAHAGQQQHGNQFYNQQQQPYYNQYNQQSYGGYPSGYGSYGQGGFSGYGGKAGGAYGQPQHYQQQQHQQYDHTSTTAATGYPQSSLHRADAGAAAGLGDYGRTGAVQPGVQPGLGGAGFGGGIHDSFARGSSYGQQGGQSFNTASTQPGASGNDDLKPFGDGKTAGPSPAMAAGARPGSAANTGPSQGGLPPPQSQQGMGAYAGFPGHMQSHGLHGTQAGSAGYGMGAGSAQGQQNAPYTGYAGFGGGAGNSYSQYPQRGGGWGVNYNSGNNGNF